MDHKEQHHEQHMKQREEEKRHHKAEHQEPKNMLPFHRAWLGVVAVILILAAVLIWTVLSRP